MGAYYFYDEELPAREPSCLGELEDGDYQFSILTMGAEAFIRMVPCDRKNEDKCFYTVSLKKAGVKKLINALQNVLYHFG